MLYTKLNIDNEKDLESIKDIGVALGSPIRINIMRQINVNGKTITELAKLNNVSFSSILFHVELLEKAGLVYIREFKAKNTYCKYVVKGCLNISIGLNDPIYPSEDVYKNYKVSIPVGCYNKAELGTNNGFFTNNTFKHFFGNTPYRPERFESTLIYTNKGFVEYVFDNSEVIDHKVKEITFTIEICSEAPYYNNNFESLIGFSINGIEVTDFISPGDFGGRKGKLNPDDVPPNSTQYGQLKTITVTEKGVFLDGVNVNENITIKNLKISKNNGVTFRVTSKELNGRYGGFNIFGKNYGDFPQDIEMIITYIE